MIQNSLWCPPTLLSSSVLGLTLLVTLNPYSWSWTKDVSKMQVGPGVAWGPVLSHFPLGVPGSGEIPVNTSQEGGRRQGCYWGPHGQGY